MKKNWIVNLPSSIRQSSELKEKISKALKTIETNSGMRFTIPQFFEAALTRFSDEVITQQINFGVAIK